MGIFLLSSTARRERKGARFAMQSGMGEGLPHLAHPLTSPLLGNGSLPLPQAAEDKS